MKRTHTLLAAAVLSLAAPAAFAGKDSGFYIGGSIASSSFDSSQDDFGIDDSDTSYKIFGGYNFGIIPMLDLAAEASYVDFGGHEGDAGDTSVEVESSGVMASGLAAFNIGPVGLFGKLGFVNWDSDWKGLTNEDDSGTDAAYGVGARFQIGSLSLRAEYEVFDLEGADINYTSIGASYTF